MCDLYARTREAVLNIPFCTSGNMHIVAVGCTLNLFTATDRFNSAQSVLVYPQS